MVANKSSSPAGRRCWTPGWRLVGHARSWFLGSQGRLSFAASIPEPVSCQHLSTAASQLLQSKQRQRCCCRQCTMAGKQGLSVPFDAVTPLILYLCSPSEERTHSGPFITALITAAGMKVPGCGGAGLCSCTKPILFKYIYTAINKSGLSLPRY